MELMSYGRRLADLAARQPDAPAIIAVSPEGADRVVTFAELDRQAVRAANLLKGRGAGPGALVVVSLPDVPLHSIVTHGAWRTGACVLPISPRLPAWERERLLAVTGEFAPVITVGSFADGDGSPDVSLASVDDLAGAADTRLPDIIAQPAQAIGSGGTSGTPKITIDGGPGAVPVVDGEIPLPPLMDAMDIHAGQVHLVCTPLYHTNAFGLSNLSLMLGDTVVLIERFDPAVVLAAIERHRVSQVLVVPSVLQRLVGAPEIDTTDLSSLETVGYGGSACPPWLTRRWIELVGPTKVYAGYGATEYHGKTALRGDEWLEHPGSCGRPIGSDLRILDEERNELPPGEVGEVYMRPHGAQGPAFRYLGADYRSVTEDGFVSLGDYGWVDEGGYLYIADRRTDLIISGGANIYPAEVEAALTEHPAVADAAVIGLPDERWGQRVHAIVEPADPAFPPTLEELEAWCRDRLAPYKIPRSLELVATMPRTEVGKISRRRLVEERAVQAQGTAADADAAQETP